MRKYRCFAPALSPRQLRLNAYKGPKNLSRPLFPSNNLLVSERGERSTAWSKAFKRARRGAAFVEMSLAILPFLAISFAVLDFAIPIFLRTTLTHAVREGSRYAITYQTKPGKTQSESVKQVVVEQAMGFLKGTDGLNKVKVRFYSPTTFAEVTGADANAGGNVVEVSVEGFTWEYMVPLWRTKTPLTIHATSSDRLEVLPSSVARPAP